MTYRIATRWLRPIAVVTVAGALAAIWWGYYHSRDVVDALPPNLRWSLSTWLRPLYAIPRLPPQARSEVPFARPVVDLGWTEPAFDRLLLAALVALVCTVIVATASARRWWTPICLLLAFVGVLAINVFVARVPDGDQSFLEPFTRRGLEYYTDVPRVNDDPLAFIANYPTLNRDHSISHHAGTHPPGGVLFQYFAQRWFGPEPVRPRRELRQPSVLEAFMGGRAHEVEVWDEASVRRLGAQSETALNVAVWSAVFVTALAVWPAWWLARTVGGAAAARRLLPLYLATPNLVLYGATCMDGVFLTVTLTALAAGVAAIRSRWSHWLTPLLMLFAGLALWAASFLTFAAVAAPLLMGVYSLCVLVRRPLRGSLMLLRCLPIGIVWLICQWAAMHWLHYDVRETVNAAIERDFAVMRISGYESLRVWEQTSAANLLAWLLGSGLAMAALALVGVAVSLTRGRFRHGPAATFGPAVALTMLALACSTLFTFETERVWLFLTPALLVVATSQFRGCVLWTLVLAASFTQLFWMETQYYLYW